MVWYMILKGLRTYRQTVFTSTSVRPWKVDIALFMASWDQTALNALWHEITLRRHQPHTLRRVPLCALEKSPGSVLSDTMVPSAFSLGHHGRVPAKSVQHSKQALRWSSCPQRIYRTWQVRELVRDGQKMLTNLLMGNSGLKVRVTNVSTRFIYHKVWSTCQQAHLD